MSTTVKATVLEIHSGDSLTILPVTAKSSYKRIYLSSYRAPQAPNNANPGKPCGL